jgi:hypothetical protein
MDWAALLPAVLGSGGIAGIAVAVQNWLGMPRAVRRIQSLHGLRQTLGDGDTRDVEALTLAIRVETFRLTARTTVRHSTSSALILLGLFIVAFIFSPVLTPPAATDPAWVAGLRGTAAGLAALGGGYTGTELMIRHSRARLVHQWLAGKPIRPPGINQPTSADRTSTDATRFPGAPRGQAEDGSRQKDA